MKRRLIELNLVFIFVLALGLLLIDIKITSHEPQKTFAIRTDSNFYTKDLQFDPNEMNLNPTLINISDEVSENNHKDYRYIELSEPSPDYLQLRSRLIALSGLTADLLSENNRISDMIPLLNLLEDTTYQIFVEVYNNPKIKKADQDLFLAYTIWNKISNQYEIDNYLAVEAENLLRYYFYDSPHLSDLNYNSYYKPEYEYRPANLTWSSDTK